MKKIFPLAAILLAAGAAHGAGLATIDGVTFADTGSRLYLPVRDISRGLDWPLSKSGKSLKLHGHAIPGNGMRTLLDGTRVVAVSWLKHAGATVRAGKTKGITVVKDAKHPGRAFYARKGMKRVFVNKKTQMLVAYQGQRTVFRSKVSTGREGKNTPTGIFKAQAYKSKLHHSRLYNNAPLPWSVQIVGNIFIHGYRSGPGHSSHGCIRLPIEGRNPARWFYYWIEPGTPVSILGKWPKNAA